MPTTGRCRGEGSKSLGSLGSVTAPGVSSQNLEIQFEKPTPGLFTSHPRSQGKAHQCDPDAPGLCIQIWKLKQKPTARMGGGQKSGVLDRGPCGWRAQISAKFRKLFLSSHVQAFDRDRSAPAAASSFTGPSAGGKHRGGQPAARPPEARDES